TYLRDPGYLSPGCDHVSEERLHSLDVDRKIIVDKKDCYLSLFASCTRLKSQQLIDNTFVSAKTNRVAKESSHSTKLAAVWAASSRLYWHNMKTSPTTSQPL